MSKLIDISNHPEVTPEEMIAQFLETRNPSIVVDDSDPIKHCQPSPIKTATSDISRSAEYVPGEYL